MEVIHDWIGFEMLAFAVASGLRMNPKSLKGSAWHSRRPGPGVSVVHGGRDHLRDKCEPVRLDVVLYLPAFYVVEKMGFLVTRPE